MGTVYPLHAWSSTMWARFSSTLKFQLCISILTGLMDSCWVSPRVILSSQPIFQTWTFHRLIERNVNCRLEKFSPHLFPHLCSNLKAVTSNGTEISSSKVKIDAFASENKIGGIPSLCCCGDLIELTNTSEGTMKWNEIDRCVHHLNKKVIKIVLA